ncbi:DNA polymerase I [Comamonas thiooxydans]|nr:DNA polymerase I [Comamonas thiooxydans]
MELKAPGQLLMHQPTKAGTAKQAAQATLLQQSTAGAARDALVMEKRRLEGIARALGLSRKTSAELVRAYFTNTPAVKP